MLISTLLLGGFLRYTSDDVARKPFFIIALTETVKY